MATSAAQKQLDVREMDGEQLAVYGRRVIDGILSIDAERSLLLTAFEPIFAEIRSRLFPPMSHFAHRKGPAHAASPHAQTGGDADDLLVPG